MIAITNIHQLEVKNVFLHGYLIEYGFLEQSPGYVNQNFSTHVCHLNRALYGLKQVPRDWFERFSIKSHRAWFLLVLKPILLYSYCNPFWYFTYAYLCGLCHYYWFKYRINKSSYFSMWI